MGTKSPGTPGTRASIRHAHGFPCSSQPYIWLATEPVCVPDTGMGTRAGYHATDKHGFPCTSLSLLHIQNLHIRRSAFYPRPGGTGTFRAQDLSFPRTNSPYGELSFPELSFPRLFVPGNFRSLGTIVPFVLRNFRSLDLSSQGTFIPRTFRSQELSFLRLFYKALAMKLNADSYSNCQNLFRSRPSICFPKIN